MNRGSGAERERLREAPHPSMRPRFMNRGSKAKEASEAEKAGPSMRPRFMNRGSLAELLAKHNEVALQ